MTYHQEIWTAEHELKDTFTRIHSDKPSGPIPGFTDFLVEQGLKPTNTDVLDIGCGSGRNSRYLASRGFHVTGTDFVPEALTTACERTEGEVQFTVVDLMQPLPFKGKQFGAIIDCTTTLCIPNPGRDFAISEAHRVLTEGGYYLFYGVAPSDLVTRHPGPEPNSGLFPRTGMFEKQYPKEELLESYKAFGLVSFESVNVSDIIEGRETDHLMWIAIFQKQYLPVFKPNNIVEEVVG